MTESEVHQKRHYWASELNRIADKVQGKNGQFSTYEEFLEWQETTAQLKFSNN
ncbi:MAG: hypothetical protein GY727_06870 [Gammaproteobacteria bacterium]|nr:hypothetical protein [Gammaproteobacteria bacterium]